MRKGKTDRKAISQEGENSKYQVYFFTMGRQGLIGNVTRK